jgi:hypothetical protein
MDNPPRREHVFFSYSRKDKKWLDLFQVTLKPLIRANQISIWDDTKIKAGDIWRDEINQALASAKVAVLLVSRNFLASDFIAENELPPLLEAAQKEGLRILLVVIGHCLFEETELGRYQSINNPLRPLAVFPAPYREKELVRICGAIKAASTLTEKGKPQGQGIEAAINLWSDNDFAVIGRGNVETRICASPLKPRTNRDGEELPSAFYNVSSRRHIVIAIGGLITFLIILIVISNFSYIPKGKVIEHPANAQMMGGAYYHDRVFCFVYNKYQDRKITKVTVSLELRPKGKDGLIAVIDQTLELDPEHKPSSKGEPLTNSLYSANLHIKFDAQTTDLSISDIVSVEVE